MQSKILVLEDDFIIALDLAETVGEGGYEVLGPANTLEEAECILNRIIPDLAILDYTINDKTSSEFAQKLLKHRIPIILCTGHDSLECMPVELRDARLLKKPFNPKNALKLVNSILND